ncbi:MAG: GMC oxidoreductase, partial [Kofleriaceae bacterium]
PTRPARAHAYPQEPAALAPISSRLAESAMNLGLHPFCLPLAINHGVADQRVVEFADGPVARVEFPVRLRSACIACRTCDTYACKLEAKNDVATMMIDPMIAGLTRVMRDGTTNLARLELWPNTVVVGLDVEAGRVVRARLRRRDRTHVETIEADQFILAAGALGTPHLVLASGLHEHSPARDAVGRYLMRHDNAMVFGVFPRRPDPDHRFHKQVAIHDWYFGEPGADDVEGMTKLGGVQQMMTPPKELVRAHLPIGTKTAIGAFTEQLTGLLCIAEDQPRPENRVTLDPGVRDIYNLPQLVIEHAYSDRDERAVSALVRRAKRVLRETGAWFFHTHRVKTFSHAVGTVRMGTDPETSPLDENCKFRGLANLWITDGSALPMSAGVNPSLTIAANALRAADAIVREVA